MESITYTLWCEECGEEIAAYKGETGRNGFSRGVEHLNYLEANDEDKSVLWLHSLHHHQGLQDVKYNMKVTGAFQEFLETNFFQLATKILSIIIIIIMMIILFVTREEVPRLTVT